MSPGKASKGKAKEKSKEKPKEKSKEKSAEEWAAIRPRFTELYMGGGDGKQGMALEKVVDILAAEGFVAS